MWKKNDVVLGTESTASWASAPAEPVTRTPVKTENKAVIGATLVVNGDISGSEDLLIEGRVEGGITLRSNTVTIGKSGHVKGNVSAKTIHVVGAHTGNLYGDDQIVIHTGANVTGDVAAPRVTLEDGAKLKGTIDMDSKSGSEARPRTSSSASETKSEKRTLDQNGELRSSL